MVAPRVRVRQRLQAPVTWLLLLGCLFGGRLMVLAGETPGDKPVQTPDMRPSDPPAVDPLVTAAQKIVKELETIVGVSFKKPPNVRVLVRNEILKILVEELDHEIPAGEFAFAQQSLIRFGLAPPGFKLRASYLKLLTEQIAGFYVPRRKTLFLIRGTPLQSMVTAHELHHALQDQLFDLDKLSQERKHNDDASAAMAAVVEGEATLSMSLYLARYGKAWETVSGLVFSALMSEQQFRSLRLVPLIMRERLLFPYMRGQTFAGLALRRGGWENVREMYAELPESTEQILHPRKYFGARDRPTTISLAGLVAALGPGWRALGVNTLGEFGVGILLRTLGAKHLEANNAASGWDGDRYMLMEKQEGQKVEQALVWISTWDSAGHAHRFKQAYARRLGHKHGQETERATPNKHLWELESGRTLFLSRWGQEVLLLDGLRAEERLKVRSYLNRAKKSGALFLDDQREDGKPPPAADGE